MPLLFTSQQQQQQQQQRSSQNQSNKFTINSNSSPTRSIKAPSSTRKPCITKLKNNNNGDDYSPIIMKFNPASASLQQNSSTSNHHNQSSHLFKHINSTNQSSYRPNLNASATTANQQPRVTFVLPSSNTSTHNHVNNFSKSVNIASSSTSISQPLPYVKTKRSGSITTLLPLKVT